MLRKLLIAAAFSASGCAGALSEQSARPPTIERFSFELGPSATIEPAPAPRQQDWASFDILRLEDGARDRIEIEPFASSGVRGRFPDGCLWTRQADWFSPSDSWAFCGDSETWRTAQATVRRTGSLWPLTVGASAAYERAARSAKTGAISRRTTTCAVTEAVDVRRSSGATEPAYKVRCDDGRRVRTSWWSPTAGLLFYRQDHRSRGVERFWERIDG